MEHGVLRDRTISEPPGWKVSTLRTSGPQAATVAEHRHVPLASYVTRVSARAWQGEGEYAASAGGGVDPDPAFVHLCNFAGNGQAKAG